VFDLGLYLIALQAGCRDFSHLMQMVAIIFRHRVTASELVLYFPIVFLLTGVVELGPSLAGVLVL